VVGETWDGSLNDVNGFHVRPEHVHAAIAAASDGPVPEGGVGGGTGMVCHEFKGGIGTASRALTGEQGGWTVGVLVQANYGRRAWLRIDGVPVGEAIPTSELASPHDQADAADAARSGAGPIGSNGWARTARSETGSIIVLVATDAPLLPNQCARLAQRAGLGLARVGGTGGNYSGDLFLAWSTGNRGLPPESAKGDGRMTVDVAMVADRAIDPLFDAVIEATEEAIVNALVTARTMVGRDGVTAHALPHDQLLEVMDRYGRGRRTTV